MRMKWQDLKRRVNRGTAEELSAYCLSKPRIPPSVYNELDVDAQVAALQVEVAALEKVVANLFGMLARDCHGAERVRTLREDWSGVPPANPDATEN